MFKLLANNKVLDEFKTKKECEMAKADYRKIEEAIYDKNTIKFEVVEVV